MPRHILGKPFTHYVAWSCCVCVIEAGGAGSRRSAANCKRSLGQVAKFCTNSFARLNPFVLHFVVGARSAWQAALRRAAPEQLRGLSPMALPRR